MRFIGRDQICWHVAIQTYQVFLYATFVLCGVCNVACIAQNIKRFCEVLRRLVSKLKVQSWVATTGTVISLLSVVHVLAKVTVQRHEANLVLIKAAAVAKAGATVILSTLVTRTKKYPGVNGVC